MSISKEQLQKVEEEIINKMTKEGRSTRYMTEMHWKEFVDHSSRMIADGVISSGFSSISASLHTILNQYSENKILNIK